MGFFRPSGRFDRAKVLEAANKARSKKKRARAIELYRWILAMEPQNQELHAKLGPLLAETGQDFDAWLSFNATARASLREGHIDKAIAVYREAAQLLPLEIQAWQGIGRLERKRGRNMDGVKSLLDGAHRFKRRGLRSHAIYLLRMAREIEPFHFQTVLQLARLLGTTSQRPEAHRMLDGLTQRCSGGQLRRIRAVQFRLSPGVVTAWRWLQAAVRPSTHASRTRAARGA